MTDNLQVTGSLGNRLSNATNSQIRRGMTILNANSVQQRYVLAHRHYVTSLTVDKILVTELLVIWIATDKISGVIVMHNIHRPQQNSPKLLFSECDQFSGDNNISTTFSAAFIFPHCSLRVSSCSPLVRCWRMRRFTTSVAWSSLSAH